MAFTPLSVDSVDTQTNSAPPAASGFTPLSLDQVEIPVVNTPTYVPVQVVPQEFRDRYIAQQQGGAFGKALDVPLNAVKGLYGLASDIAGIPAGLGEASGAETPVGTTARSVLEGARRLGGDFINLGRMGLDKAIRSYLTNPLNPQAGFVQSEVGGVNSPLSRAIASGIGVPTEGFQSRTPTEQEILNAYKEEQFQNSLNTPEISRAGQISEDLAKGSQAGIATALPLIGAEERALIAGLLRKPVTGLANTLERVASRGVVKQPLEDVITNVTGITPIEGGVEKAQTAVGRILEKTGELPTREVDAAKTLLERTEPTQKALLNDAKTNLKAFDERGGTINELDAIQQAKNEVASRFQLATADEGALNAIFDKPEFRNLKENATSSNVQEHLQEYNTKFQAFEDKTSPEATAYRITRDFLSNMVDDVVKLESKKDISPYRDWGTVEDFKQGLESRISGAQQAQASGRTSAGGIPFTKPGIVAKGVKAAGGRALVPRQIESINQGTLRLVKDIKKPEAARTLTSDELSSIRSRINPPPIIGSSPSSPAIPPPNTAQLIESKIQQRIGSYSPTLVNSLSEADLRQLAIDQLKDEGLIPRR